MVEWGVFNDEGMVEGGFASEADARNAIQADYAEDEWIYTAEVCPDHEEQPRDTCEDCLSEEDEEDES